MNMQASERLFLQTVGRFVKQWTAPLFERLEKIEDHLNQPQPFTAAQQQVVRRLIDEAMANALTTGKFASLDDVERVFASAPPGPPGPPGRDGRDGTDGIDGKTVDPDVVADVIQRTVADAVAALPVSVHITGAYIDRAGDLFFTNSSGGVFAVGHVVGKDADQAAVAAQIAEAIKAACEKYPPPKDGKDGFSLSDFTLEFDGERTVTFKFVSGELTQVHKLVFPVTIYRGVWREGDFQRGDEVTLDGSQWIAMADTATRPGTPDCHWKLAVKKGRDGKEGKRGPPGDAGRNGRDGRDLTQMGFDGRKY